ncbi:hypothetical protein GE21DRAFT_8418 [Neurospora crassa]|uniref:Uncharacterized protein n=1 Tax=Neurospora crassa (strain ATCC 24698 / 74-OR23-1A / CBS 708.71 / DSM 1257 / FGSC 987) TaxID=367110 RepID=Q7S1K3_NEUCR|nr:hypothetical protein NCU09952 [Neurospora crassa OR74A]EAA29223.1 hypothetical protein NCU09952 [Neurospora crassa OR74A]KHE79594.1 hypothetical protein GE21DRAFT_8418 [Neurospora crassa]|eukprot:XP_958459.1 hypothetical protein NCU09952 [Neurospora crassa OR74A]
MASTPQLPSKDDPDHPLNLLPIPELKADLSNFMQWRHILCFHLQYKKLTRYVVDIKFDESSTEEERQIQEMEAMHAYSLIASKIENIAPLFEKVMGRHFYQADSGLFHHEPAKLWDDIIKFRRLTRKPDA